DEGDHAEIGPAEQQGEDGADAGGGERGEDGEGMDVALVEDAEDDVDGDQRGEDQQRLVGERGLEGLGRSLERGTEARRETETTGGGLDGGDGVAEGDPGGEVEGEGDGGKMAPGATWTAGGRPRRLAHR